ncbi:hypothetical protein HY442_00740 [Candidatus Parcubacteria bacterium]|nr:hypothetical protein [Candidatus Parcubacteria bacterium]
MRGFLRVLYRLLFRDIRETLRLLRQLTGLTEEQIRTRLWPRAQMYWHRLVGATIRFVLFPLIFFLGGGLLGGISPLAKDLLVGFGTLFAAVPFFYFLQRAALLGIVVPILFEASRVGDLIVGEALAKRLEQYGRTMAGILASEFVIGLLVWIFPLHEQPRYLLWLIIAALAYAMWALWTGGVGFWKKVVRWVPAAVIAFIFLAMIFPAVPRALGYARQSINDSITCTLPGASCPPPSDRRAPAGPPSLPFNRKAAETKARPDGCAEVWMAGNEEEGILVGTLEPGQTARVRFLDGRIVYNRLGAHLPHWGGDFYLDQWKPLFRFSGRPGIPGNAILGVLGELDSPAEVRAFDRNRDEFTVKNGEPGPLPVRLYYHQIRGYFYEGGWDGTRAHLEVCTATTVASRGGGTP